MPRYTNNDTVRLIAAAPGNLRPGALAWVIGVLEEPRSGAHFSQFPAGTVYSVEYEDGVAVDVHESLLEAVT